MKSSNILDAIIMVFKNFIKNIVIILFIMTPLKLYSHGLEYVTGLIMSPSVQYSFLEKDADYQLNTNLILILLNIRGKVSLLKFERSNCYLGVGLANILRIQYGFASKKSPKSLCLRSDIVLFGDQPFGFGLEKGFWKFRKGIVVSLNIEKNIERSKDWSTGIGLGLYF